MKVTANEIIELVKMLPDSDLHIQKKNESSSITNEWLCGSFAGRGFEAPTLEEAAEELIEYLYKHIGHNSMVGQSVTDSGFPDLKRVKKYCMRFEKLED
jgi:oligoribonuclease (3'-5' exoribonuclease)